jgi:FAD/FMN-containing dehydrogenase
MTQTGTVSHDRALVEGALGPVIQPGDATYDGARAVWNGLIDRRPKLVVRCARTEDVVACVGYARERGLPLAVRGGGHGVAGTAVCEGGLVIDLRDMAGVTVDPARRIVRAGGGATIGDVDAVTQRHGLAVPLGVVSATGIAGLVLGGGYGWLRHAYGMSCDNLLAAEVVTASGRVVRASEQEHSDLLWGLRGGGGNFGVVTRFELRAHPVGPEVAFVFCLKDGRGEKTARALLAFRELSAREPAETSSIAALGVVPPEEHYPAALHGTPYVLFGAMYAGGAAEGERALRSLRDHGDNLVDASGLMPYVDAQRMFDADYPNGRRYYWKSLSLLRFDDEVIDRAVALARAQPSPLSTTDLWPIHPCGDGSSDGRSGAFHGRHAAFLINAEANWTEPKDDGANITWARELVAGMEPFSDRSRYLNFAGFHEEGDEMMRSAFGPNHARLVALKQAYDPDNLFRFNQNIVP